MKIPSQIRSIPGWTVVDASRGANFDEIWIQSGYIGSTRVRVYLQARAFNRAVPGVQIVAWVSCASSHELVEHAPTTHLRLLREDGVELERRERLTDPIRRAVRFVDSAEAELVEIARMLEAVDEVGIHADQPRVIRAFVDRLVARGAPMIEGANVREEISALSRLGSKAAWSEELRTWVRGIVELDGGEGADRRLLDALVEADSSGPLAQNVSQALARGASESRGEPQ